MLYNDRYSFYVGLVARLKSNHRKMSTKEYKKFNVVSYLQSVYYSNGFACAKCDFNDKLLPLKPIAIGVENESDYYEGSMNDYLSFFSGGKEVAIKIKTDEFIKAISVYKSTAKQLKMYAMCILGKDSDSIHIDMIPINKSTSVFESKASIKMYDISISNDYNDYPIFFRFNIAIMLEALKMYTDDEYIIIKCGGNKEATNFEEIINTFTLQSYNVANNNMVWSFIDMPIHHMQQYLRKIKT